MIAGKLMQTYLSNPDPTSTNANNHYHNANILGMDFLRKFKGFKIGGILESQRVFLELIQ